jgi:hypothetical protein
MLKLSEDKLISMEKQDVIVEELMSIQAWTTRNESDYRGCIIIACGIFLKVRCMHHNGI